MALDVTTIVSGINGLLSNTHLVSTPGGVIVVDPPMLLSDARKVSAVLSGWGVRAAAFVYTHPHPDHVNGTTAIRDGRDVPVYATLATDQVSRQIDGPKRAFWTPVFPDDYPPETTFATDLVRDGECIDICGVTLRVRDIGAGECATASVWIAEEDAFIGDLAYSHVHPWLFEGRSQSWLGQLDRARPLLDGLRLHVGHGPSGSIALLDDQAAYIRAFQGAIRDVSRGQAIVDDDAKRELVQRMTTFWPDAPLQTLITMSADAVATELSTTVSQTAK